MFTLRFESDSRSSNDGGVATVVSAKSYRALKQRDGSVAVTLPGDDEQYVIDGSLGGYDRCFVMNEAGATIDNIRCEKNRAVTAGIVGAQMNADAAKAYTGLGQRIG